MSTVADTPTTRNVKAYHATFHGLSGVLTKSADRLLFLEHASGAVVTVTEADYPHLVVLGEVASSLAQYGQDMAAGGYAAIACARPNEEGQVMVYQLSPEQSARWQEGGWSSWRVEADVIDDLGRQDVQEPNAVVLADGTVAFWVTAPRLRI